MRKLNPDLRAQDDALNGDGWRYYNCEHGGEYPDTMPQAIIAVDASGIEAVYVYSEKQTILHVENGWSPFREAN